MTVCSKLKCYLSAEQTTYELNNNKEAKFCPLDRRVDSLINQISRGIKKGKEVTAMQAELAVTKQLLKIKRAEAFEANLNNGIRVSGGVDDGGIRVTAAGVMMEETVREAKVGGHESMTGQAINSTVAFESMRTVKTTNVDNGEVLSNVAIETKEVKMSKEERQVYETQRMASEYELVRSSSARRIFDVNLKPYDVLLSFEPMAWFHSEYICDVYTIPNAETVCVLSSLSGPEWFKIVQLSCNTQANLLEFSPSCERLIPFLQWEVVKKLVMVTVDQFRELVADGAETKDMSERYQMKDFDFAPTSANKFLGFLCRTLLTACWPSRYHSVELLKEEEGTVGTRLLDYEIMATGEIIEVETTLNHVPGGHVLYEDVPSYAGLTVRNLVTSELFDTPIDCYVPVSVVMFMAKHAKANDKSSDMTVKAIVNGDLTRLGFGNADAESVMASIRMTKKDRDGNSIMSNHQLARIMETAGGTMPSIRVLEKTLIGSPRFARGGVDYFCPERGYPIGEEARRPPSYVYMDNNGYVKFEALSKRCKERSGFHFTYGIKVDRLSTHRILVQPARGSLFATINNNNNKRSFGQVSSSSSSSSSSSAPLMLAGGGGGGGGGTSSSSAYSFVSANVNKKQKKEVPTFKMSRNVKPSKTKGVMMPQNIDEVFGKTCYQPNEFMPNEYVNMFGLELTDGGKIKVPDGPTSLMKAQKRPPPFQPSHYLLRLFETFVKEMMNEGHLRGVDGFEELVKKNQAMKKRAQGFLWMTVRKDDVLKACFDVVNGRGAVAVPARAYCKCGGEWCLFTKSKMGH
jgi:hypothetical protein